MYIEIYEHQCPNYALERNETPRRICVALHDNNGEFIDSFDYKASTNQVRFYGDNKHYDWDKVSDKKLKLWRTDDLRKYLIRLEVKI